MLDFDVVREVISVESVVREVVVPVVVLVVVEEPVVLELDLSGVDELVTVLLVDSLEVTLLVVDDSEVVDSLEVVELLVWQCRVSGITYLELSDRIVYALIRMTTYS